MAGRPISLKHRDLPLPHPSHRDWDNNTQSYSVCGRAAFKGHIRGGEEG